MANIAMREISSSFLQEALCSHYHVCSCCRASQVWTSEGPVDVPKDAVERVEADAKKVEIKPKQEKQTKSGTEEKQETGAKKIDKPSFTHLGGRI